MKCFEHHKQNNESCQKKICRYWIESDNCYNCTIIGADSEERFTLEDIGKMFSVTRMRICQVEKIAINKLKEKVLSILI